jgi:hypothetical protein
MKRSEYEKAAQEFRSRLLAEAQKPQEEQEWPDYDDWLSVPGVSTCTTPTCRAFAQHLPVTLHENADGIHRGQCGECHRSTIVRPVLEDD